MLSKFTIAARLIGGFALLLLLLISVGVLGLWGLNRQASLTENMLQHDLNYSLDLIEARHQVTDLRRFEKDIFLNFESIEKVKEYDQKWHIALEKANAAIKSGLTNASSGDVQKLNDLTQHLKVYADGFNRISDEVEAKKYLKAADINAEFSKYKEPVRSMQDGLTTLADDAIAKAKGMEKTLGTITTATISISITLMFFAILIGVASALMIIRSIRKPLAALQAVITEIDQTGNLALRLNQAGIDEISQSSAVINRLLINMSKVISESRKNSSQLLSSAETLSTAARQMTDSSEIQSSASSATAAAVEELSVSVNMISSSAEGLNAEARQGASTAAEGALSANRTASEIRQIADNINSSAAVIDQLNQRSGEIGSIVMVIKDIADQTNLLALNAAIEAARAGDLGRGFAVVADEVRKLAERTTQATTEITSKIESVQRDTGTASEGMQHASRMVESGVRNTQSVAESLAHLEQQSKNTVSDIAQMADAIGEQSSASQDIANNIEKIAQASEENHATASSTSELSEELRQIAMTLNTIISQYHT
ncbi:methyl-accepting chemotaxis protein [Iodobacter fluviatilis]|uniref:Chemotaxis regulator BdlA n=1 Tax=Iodobacter fluviatilis TaxID=537 RepID=A0A377Q7M6_9NEIS|nr:methyl-accepting chemotaxis protein [Iodobacter fluviatilis]TCU89553.1 methyl-accepting chemotaxis protein [Iodobacter fluviatilis]STQ90923.1 Chemotaxis regulator BdlA [Iodobacter fluviatilis]